MLLAHTLTHTLGKNGNSGVVRVSRGSSSAKVSRNTVLAKGEETIYLHSVFALYYVDSVCLKFYFGSCMLISVLVNLVLDLGNSAVDLWCCC